MTMQMIMDRPGMKMEPMSGSSMPMSGMPSMGNMMMVPRCKVKMEKCAGGMKMTCICDDEMSCATLQNMCMMLADGLCSCYCMKNGMIMCQCSMAMCNCKCTMTEDGCCIMCTSGDKSCCNMIQACCECMSCCLEEGCMCMICFGGTPICCCTC